MPRNIEDTDSCSSNNSSFCNRTNIMQWGEVDQHEDEVVSNVEYGMASPTGQRNNPARGSRAAGTDSRYEASPSQQHYTRILREGALEREKMFEQGVCAPNSKHQRPQETRNTNRLNQVPNWGTAAVDTLEAQLGCMRQARGR